jgi:hypothetical protein
MSKPSRKWNPDSISPWSVRFEDMVMLAKCETIPPEGCILLRKRFANHIGLPVALVGELLKASVACEKHLKSNRWIILTVWLVYLSPVPCKWSRSLEISFRKRLGSKTTWKKNAYFVVTSALSHGPQELVTPVQSRVKRQICQSANNLSPKSNQLSMQRDIIKTLVSQKRGLQSQLKKENKSKRSLEVELVAEQIKVKSALCKVAISQNELQKQQCVRTEHKHLQKENKSLSQIIVGKKREIQHLEDSCETADEKLTSLKKQKTTYSKPLSRKAYKRVHKQKQRISQKATQLESEWEAVANKLELLTGFIQRGDMTTSKLTEICRCIGSDLSNPKKKNQLQQLEIALGSPIKMKHKGAYNDNVAY